RVGPPTVRAGPPTLVLELLALLALRQLDRLPQLLTEGHFRGLRSRAVADLHRLQKRRMVPLVGLPEARDLLVPDLLRQVADQLVQALRFGLGREIGRAAGRE